MYDTLLSSVNIYCPVAVSMSNLKNSRRHTNSGWKLVAVFPIISEDGGIYKEHKVDFTERKIDLFHKCVSILVKPIQEAFYNPSEIVCSDGRVRTVKLVVAVWLGDREEHERLCRMIAVTLLSFCVIY